ncbi:IS3 family transposase [Aurantivibrio plasticivorans]
MGTVSSEPKKQRFQFIEEHRKQFGVRYLCRRLSVSHSGFYKWLVRPESQREVDNKALTQTIRWLFDLHDGNYGSPRIHKTLVEEGQLVNRKRIARIMREERLVAKAAKLYRRKSLPGSSCIKVGNLRWNVAPPDGPNQQWAGDVSYLKLKGEWIYLSVILDLYSRKVIGWSLGRNRTAELTLKSLEMALSTRKIEPGLIFHSDKGSEYGAHDYQNRLRAAGIRPSMNRPKSMTDNIHVESFFRTFKTESFHGEVFEDEEHLYDVTQWYLNEYYNCHRMHTSLGFKSPVQYERMVA